MNIPEIYDYLKRARRDLWATLEGVQASFLTTATHTQKEVTL
jgi:hypothetical protein